MKIALAKQKERGLGSERCVKRAEGKSRTDKNRDVKMDKHFFLLTGARQLDHNDGLGHWGGMCPLARIYVQIVIIKRQLGKQMIEYSLVY